MLPSPPFCLLTLPLAQEPRVLLAPSPPHKMAKPRAWVALVLSPASSTGPFPICPAGSSPYHLLPRSLGPEKVVPKGQIHRVQLDSLDTELRATPDHARSSELLHPCLPNPKCSLQDPRLPPQSSEMELRHAWSLSPVHPHPRGQGLAASQSPSRGKECNKAGYPSPQGALGDH